MKFACINEKVENLKDKEELSRQEKEMLALAEKCLKTARVYSLLDN